MQPWSEFPLSGFRFHIHRACRNWYMRNANNNSWNGRKNVTKPKNIKMIPLEFVVRWTIGPHWHVYLRKYVEHDENYEKINYGFSTKIMRYSKVKNASNTIDKSLYSAELGFYEFSWSLTKISVMSNSFSISPGYRTKFVEGAQVNVFHGEYFILFIIC